MGIAIVLVGIALVCVLLFNFAVYVVPAYLGLSAFFWALHAGAGIGSPIVGLLVGVAVFMFGKWAFASRYIWLRWLVLVLFVAPAGFAGYSMVLQIAGLGIMPSPVWQHIFAVLAAFAVAGTTFTRLVAPVEFAR